MFDWTANLAGIGDRLECVMLNEQNILVKSYIAATAAATTTTTVVSNRCTY